MDVMGRIISEGCHPPCAPPRAKGEGGARDDGFDQSSQGRVGGGVKGARRQTLSEAVNHRGLQDRGRVAAQRCRGVITIPSHLASRYMRLLATADLTCNHSPSLRLFEKALFAYPVLHPLIPQRWTRSVTVLLYCRSCRFLFKYASGLP